MSNDESFTKRQILSLLLGGGALMFGASNADSTQANNAKAYGHPRHTARKHKRSASRHGAHSTSSNQESSAPGSPSGYGAPSESESGGGGGGGGGGYSDRRLKRDIVRLGVSPSGLPIYAFQYVWGGPRYIGVMAQDLLDLRPDAVILDDSGYYRVNYAAIDVEMRTAA